MIITFLCTWLVGWSLATLLRRAARTTPLEPLAPVAPVAPVDQRTPRDSAPAGPEDDPAGWPSAAVRGDWTELDERQLIRLLTESTS
jgi:hypothetical protein